MSEPLERIRTVGDAEFHRNWRANIWVPITATCLLVLASILWFFALDDVWYPLAYMIVAMTAVINMWVSRATYAALRAERERLSLVLTILAAVAVENASEDEG